MVIISVIWYFAGRWEWRLSDRLTKRIYLLSRVIAEEPAVPVSLKIEAWKYGTENIEKDVYMVRKSGKGSNSIVMNIDLSEADGIDDAEKEKVRSRLEKRFPGLTVNFFEGFDQGGQNAVLYTD